VALMWRTGGTAFAEHPDARSHPFLITEHTSTNKRAGGQHSELCFFSGVIPTTTIVTDDGPVRTGSSWPVGIRPQKKGNHIHRRADALSKSRSITGCCFFHPDPQTQPEHRCD